jgi:hypothetical protein
MKFRMAILFGITMFVLTGCTIPLKMSPPSTLNIANINQLPYTAGLFIEQSVKEYVYLYPTGFEKYSYPIGNQTAEIFKKNMPLVFKDVVEANSITPSQDVDLIVKPSIVKFETVMGSTYNPYIATIVYHIDIYNKKGEKIFAQTAVGEAKTGKGLLSNFLVWSLCTEVAQMAMDNAVQKIIEGLSETDELKNLK